MRIAFIVNVDWFFVSHRLPIAMRALDEGHDVWVITKDTGKRITLEKKGIHFIDFPFERSGTNPFHELKCVLKLKKILERNKFDIIHNVTLKASLLGAFAARLAKNQKVVNAISGLGYSFTGGNNTFSGAVVKLFAKIAFSGADNYFIFQNPDDSDIFLSLGITKPDKVFMIKGSGVDIREYSYCEPAKKERIILFLLPARVLRDKGVLEFVAAAKLLENELKGKAKFIIAGQCDKFNRASIPETEIHNLEVQDYIEWVGEQRDMVSTYRNCDVVVLPSYREGLPKSLIEACAIGRPIITTNAPGCKECVIDGVNGLMVPVKDKIVLAAAMKKLFANPAKRLLMGEESRKLAEDQFDVETVINKHFEIYYKLLNC